MCSGFFPEHNPELTHAEPGSVMAQAKKQSQSNQALEMQMRDVLDGLEEMACYFSYQAIDESFEILSIERPPEQDPLQNAQRASVHDLSIKQKQRQEELENERKTILRSKRRSKNLYVDIADYLISREQQQNS